MGLFSEQGQGFLITLGYFMRISIKMPGQGRMEDVEFKEDGGVEVWMRKTKTDVVGRGSRCKFMRKECGGVSVAKILKWYMVLLDWEPSSYVFC